MRGPGPGVAGSGGLWPAKGNKARPVESWDWGKGMSYSPEKGLSESKVVEGRASEAKSMWNLTRKNMRPGGRRWALAEP